MELPDENDDNDDDNKIDDDDSTPQQQPGSFLSRWTTDSIGPYIITSRIV
jgi:hypothetical protein